MASCSRLPGRRKESGHLELEHVAFSDMNIEILDTSYDFNGFDR